MQSQVKTIFKSLGYQTLTPIQEQVYQPMVEHQDVIGLSPTGSGKTVAFAMPIVVNLRPVIGMQFLILEPSQELAVQTTNVMRRWLTPLDRNVLSLTGGANIKRQIERLKTKPTVIVGTPGRVMNLIQDKKLKCDQLQTIIIDEADDLLQGETLSTVRAIVSASPAQVQLTYFSATDTAILHDLRKWFGREPLRIDVRSVDHSSGPVRHRWLNVSRRKRNQMLKRLLHINGFKALVFFKQMADLNQAFSFFHHAHLNQVQTLTSNQNQIQRQKAMKGFRTGKVQLLLTTDVAARGLDIPRLPAVINYDLPKTKNEYIHRTGRTGRMGEAGLVINFGDDHDFRDLKKVLTDTQIDIQPIYFDENQLSEHKPSIDLKPKQIKKDRSNEHHNKVNRSNHQIQSAAKVSNQARNAQPITKKQVKHRKKKHLKNKGMRKKWRDQDQLN